MSTDDRDVFGGRGPRHRRHHLRNAVSDLHEPTHLSDWDVHMAVYRAASDSVTRACGPELYEGTRLEGS